MLSLFCVMECVWNWLEILIFIRKEFEILHVEFASRVEFILITLRRRVEQEISFPNSNVSLLILGLQYAERAIRLKGWIRVELKSRIHPAPYRYCFISYLVVEDQFLEIVKRRRHIFKRKCKKKRSKRERENKLFFIT